MLYFIDLLYSFCSRYLVNIFYWLLLLLLLLLHFFFLLLLLLTHQFKFVKISLRLLRTASNYIQGAHAAHTHIYTRIRVDWNLYFSLSLSYTLIRVLISIVLYWKKTKKKKKTDQWIALLLPIFFRISEKKLKQYKSVKFYKSVSYNLVFYFYDHYFLLLLKIWLVRVHYYIHVWIEIPFI